MNTLRPLTLSGAQWYALHVRERYEKTVSAVLRNKGYEEFLPLYRSRRRWSDRMTEVELPLLPGYVFCHLDLNDRRTPIVTTPGVIQILGAGRVPMPVADCEIAALHAIIESGLPAEPWPYLVAGTVVRIDHGSLAGMEGIFVEVRKRHRLVVSVTLLQRSVAVEIDGGWATPIHPVWRENTPLTVACCGSQS
jgi:transcription antitermination factor NusG